MSNKNGIRMIMWGTVIIMLILFIGGVMYLATN